MPGWSVSFSEYCGNPERHEFVYLAVEDIAHSRTKTKNPEARWSSARFANLPRHLAIA
jgi:hypothetical protein